MNLTILLFFVIIFAFYIKAAHNFYLKTHSIKSSLIYFMLDFLKLILVLLIPSGNIGQAIFLGYLFSQAEIEVFGEPFILIKIKNLFNK